MIETSPASLAQLGHLLRRQHPGHRRHRRHVHHSGHAGVIHLRHVVHHGNSLAALAQPGLHEADFVGLRDADPLAELLHILAAAVFAQQIDHLHCLRMVVDHALHEIGIGLTDRRSGDFDGGCGKNLAGRAGRARLDDCLRKSHRE